MEKETFEESAEKYANELPEPYNYGINLDKKKGFIEGAKWQQEKMYSEEEVLVLLHKRDKHSMDNPDTFNGWLTPKEWFEQFKKK